MPFDFNSVAKQDDNSITIDIVKPEERKQTIFTYEYLISQRDAIQKQKDDFDTARDAELKEVNDLLAQMDSLGVKPVPIELTGGVDAPVIP